jgi:hypothetical protein
MSHKVPYDIISVEANKLLQKMAITHDLKTISYWWDIYVSLLEASGWTPIEFDQETAKRVDAGWDDPNQTIWN